MRWAPIRRAADLEAAQPLGMVSASGAPTQPLDLDLTGRLALRGILLHEPALRAEVRGSAQAPALARRRRRTLNHYREALRRRGGL